MRKLFGPMWRLIFQKAPPEVIEAKHRVEILAMLEGHNRDELMQSIMRQHDVSRVIAEEMFERRLREIKAGSQLDL